MSITLDNDNSLQLTPLDLHQHIADLELLVAGHNQKENEREGLLAAEQERRRIAEALYQASLALNSSLNYGEVLDRVLEQARHLIPHDAASIMLVEGNVARTFRWYGHEQFTTQNESVPFSLDITTTPTFRAMQETRSPLVVTSVEADSTWIKQPEKTWIKSYLGAPICTRERVIGFINLNSAIPGFFGADDIEPLQALAALVGQALSNAQLYDRGRQEVIERVRALKQERNFISAVLDTAGALVMVLNRQGRIIRFNRACEQVTGYTFAEVKGKYWRDILLPPETAGPGQVDTEKLWLDQPSPRYESYWLTKDGQRRLIACSNTVLFDHEGGVEYILNTGIDLTDRKQMEEALRRAHDELERRVEERTAELSQANASLLQQMAERKLLEKQLHQAQKMEALGRLTGGIAHDFNNLLTAIIGFTELIRLHCTPDDPIEELVDRVIGSSQRAAALVRQLLIFSRRQIIEPQILDLNRILAEVDKMLCRIIGEDIELKTLLQPNLWSVKVDSAQIEQVIVNLVVNARDAMPDGGRIIVETANVTLDEGYTAGHLGVQPGQYILLAVSDTGIGMTDEIKARLFEPFFTTKPEGKGTGLGLATVYGIVKQSGGDIWVYSEVGQGTTFKIYLPRVETMAQPSLRPEVGTAMPKGKETILLVEDDPEVRALARLILHGQGYTLLEAGDGQEALNLFSRYSDPIHLILTDVIMPGMNGKTLIEQLSQTQPNVKILFMSGYTDNMIAQHGVLDPGLAFLQKPFSPVTLARKVREVLDQK